MLKIEYGEARRYCQAKGTETDMPNLNNYASSLHYLSVFQANYALLHQKHFPPTHRYMIDIHQCHPSKFLLS